MTPGFLTPNIPTSQPSPCSQPRPPPSVWPDHPASLSRQAAPPSGIFTRSPWPKDELQLAFKALCGQEYSLFSLPKPPPTPETVSALPLREGRALFQLCIFHKALPASEGPLSESSPPFRAQLNPHPEKPALMTTVSRGHSSAPSPYPMHSPPPSSASLSQP